METSCLGALLAIAGVGAGVGLRAVLARLRRGAHVRPAWCELVAGALFAAVGAGWAAGVVPAAWVPALLGLGLITVTGCAVDLVSRRLPDALTLPAVPAVLVLLTPLGAAAVLRGVGGAAVLLSAHALVHLIAPHALGAGDVKLAASVGAVLAAAGWPTLPVWAVSAALLTALMAVFGRGPPRRLPHGVSMLAAAWLLTAAVAAGLPGLG